jgi:NAD-dependent deacetylase
MNELESIKEILNQAKRVTVVTGAGISAESGIPTFRGEKNSLWSKYDPMEMATAVGYANNKEVGWAWYQWRIATVMQAQPNAGHLALAELAKCFDRLDLYTQNVDDLHERAGSIVTGHFHGTLFGYKCIFCQQKVPFVAPNPRILHDPQEKITPPRCKQPSCKGYLRPDVVWFGENLDEDLWAQAIRSIDDSDVTMVIGTSSIVHPVAGLAKYARRKAVRKVIEINLTSTLGTTPHAHVSWQVSAAEGLPQLLG